MRVRHVALSAPRGPVRPVWRAAAVAAAAAQSQCEPASGEPSPRQASADGLAMSAACPATPGARSVPFAPSTGAPECVGGAGEWSGTAPCSRPESPRPRGTRASPSPWLAAMQQAACFAVGESADGLLVLFSRLRSNASLSCRRVTGCRPSLVVLVCGVAPCRAFRLVLLRASVSSS